LKLHQRIDTIWRKYGPWISPWQIVQGAAAAALFGLIWLLPPRLASNAGSALARTVGPLLPWHRRGMANIAHVYPDMTAAARRELMDRVWDNLGRTVGEFARLSEISATVTISGLEHVPPEGTPTIFVAAHLANWEALRAFGRLSLRNLLTVYRRPNNAYVEQLLKLRSRHSSIPLVAKSDRVAIHLLRQLRAGGAITLFVDQKGTTGDVVLPFLGKDAITVRTPAVLAAKTGATVIPVRMVRRNRHELHLILTPPLPPIRETGEDAEREFMRRINDIISDWINDTPEQWLWIHRRWKNAEAQRAASNVSEPAVAAQRGQPSSV